LGDSPTYRDTGKNFQRSGTRESLADKGRRYQSRKSRKKSVYLDDPIIALKEFSGSERSPDFYEIAGKGKGPGEL